MTAAQPAQAHVVAPKIPWLAEGSWYADDLGARPARFSLPNQMSHLSQNWMAVREHPDMRTAPSPDIWL